MAALSRRLRSFFRRRFFSAALRAGAAAVRKPCAAAPALPGPARGAAEGSGRAAFAKGALCAAGRAAQSRAHSLHSLAHVLFYLAAQPFIIVFRFLLRHTSASLFFLVA